MVKDLQEFSRGIHPAILAHGCLGSALRKLAHRSAIPVALSVDVNARLPEQLEVAAYFIVSEALANAAKRAGASRIDISARVAAGALMLSIDDDGVGGADASRGSGLAGLSDRVEALGGSIRIPVRRARGRISPSSCPPSSKTDVVERAGCLPATPVAD